jgi:hypothetical protein
VRLEGGAGNGLRGGGDHVSESTYEITVKDVIDKLKKELVQEEQGSTAYFGAEDVDRYLRQQLHG